MVIGDEPMAVNDVHKIFPEQEIEVVAMEANAAGEPAVLVQ